ncbi:MAG: hypothetical protein ACR2M0_01770 [Chloroflexia bacterium]
MDNEPAVLPPPEPPAPDSKHGGALGERASLGAFWNAVFLPLKLAARLVASVVVVRVLKIDTYTVLAQLSALLALLGIFSDLGVERALPRFIPEFEMEGGRAGLNLLLRRVVVIKALTILPFVLALLAFPGFFSGLLNLSAADQRQLSGGLLGANPVPVLLGIVALMLVLGAASDVSVQVLYAYFRQKMTNALDVLNALLIPGLRALLVGLFSVFGALLALLIGTVISVAISVCLMFHALAEERMGLRATPRPGADPALRPSERTVWRRFTAYSAIMYMINLSTALVDQPFVVPLLSVLVADSSRERQEVALITLAFQLVRQVLQALVVPLTGVQASLFARLYAQNRIDGLRTAYASVTRFLILVLVPAGVGTILLVHNVLVLLYLQFGRDAVLTEARLPEAVTACAILAVGLFGESLIGVALQVLLVYEKHRIVLLARSVTLVSIPLMLLLEPRFGVVGVALAVATATLGSRLVALAFGLGRLGLSFPTGFLGKVALATLPMALLVGPAAALLPIDPARNRFSGPWFLLVGADVGLIGLGMLLFWLAFRRLGGLLPEDKERFAGMRIPGIKLVLRYL